MPTCRLGKRANVPSIGNRHIGNRQFEHRTTLNLALVILHADPSRGGAERYTVDLAHALAAHGGHQVSLLASSFDQVGATVRQVPLGRPAATRLGRYLRFLDALDAHLAAEPYDIVHAMLPVRRCDVYHPHAGIAAEAVRTGHLKHAGAAKQLAARVANRVNPKRQRFAAVERRLLTGPNPPVVLCLSEYVKRTVRRHYPLPDDRLATLFNAVDLQKFDPAARPEARDELRRRHGIRPEDTVALIIAQDFERKGLGETILGIGENQNAENDSLRLLVVGKQDPGRYRASGRVARRLKPGDLRRPDAGRLCLLPRRRLLRPPHPPRSLQPRRPRGVGDGPPRHQHRLQRRL